MAKIFEVGDVLPATTQLRISWNTNPSWGANFFVKTNNDNFYLIDIKFNSDVSINGVQIWDDGDYFFYEPFTEIDGGHNYIDIDTSSWTENKRIVSSIDMGSYLSVFEWQDMNAPSGYSITFEENGGSTVTDLTEQPALPNPLPTTTKANHVFAGWYYDNLFTQKANAGDELTTNVTLYAKWYTPTTWCKDIADAIREKDGTTEPIKHLDFPERILAIESAVEISQDDYDNLEEVNENVYYIVMEEE